MLRHCKRKHPSEDPDKPHNEGFLKVGQLPSKSIYTDYQQYIDGTVSCPTLKSTCNKIKGGRPRKPPFLCELDDSNQKRQHLAQGDDAAAKDTDNIDKVRLDEIEQLKLK